MDDIVRFSELTKAHLTSIVDIQLRHLADRLSDRRLTLDVSDEAKAKLAALGYDPAFGARPLKRVIQNEVANRVANSILAGDLEEGAKVHVGVVDDEIVIEPR